MTRFFVVLFALAGATAGLGIWAEQAAIWIRPSFFYPSLIFLTISTTVLYVYLYRSASNLFVQFYLLSIAIKILAYGAYMTLIIIKDRSDAFGNVVFFMLVYFAFTALEIGFLYRRKTHV